MALSPIALGMGATFVLVAWDLSRVGLWKSPKVIVGLAVYAVGILALRFYLPEFLQALSARNFFFGMLIAGAPLQPFYRRIAEYLRSNGERVDEERARTKRMGDQFYELLQKSQADPIDIPLAKRKTGHSESEDDPGLLEGWKYVYCNINGTRSRIGKWTRGRSLFSHSNASTGWDFDPNSFSSDEVTSILLCNDVHARNRSWIEEEEIQTIQKKSPILRGLIGGALLGKEGFWLGAASGIIPKTTYHTERTLQIGREEFQGELYLHLTISDGQKLKIKFNTDNEAYEWRDSLEA